MKITARGISDMFMQLERLGRTDVLVRCGHCEQMIGSPTAFSVHMLTCDLKPPGGEA